MIYQTIVMTANNFYVYLHIKQTNGEPFYVGKGKGDRCNHRKSRSDFWKYIVDKHNYEVVLLEENLTEKEAFERENYWINRIGRRDLNEGTLVNHSDGGEGTTGYKHSEKTKNKMSESLKGRKYTEERKRKMSSNHHNNKKIIDTKTNTIYPSVKVASEENNINYNTLRKKLNGQRNNNTTFRVYIG